jgi:ribonuclease PH
MAQIPAYGERQLSPDSEIWYSLKYAIAASSGFQRWQLERDAQLQRLHLEQQVQRYLRETLETLAY